MSKLLCDVLKISGGQMPPNPSHLVARLRSIHISVLRKPSGDGHMQKSTALNLCFSTGGE